MKAYKGTRNYFIFMLLVIMLAIFNDPIYAGGKKGRDREVKNEISKDISVLDIWKTKAEANKVRKENEILVGLVLKELKADSVILDKANQSRLSDSLDLYLTQFGSFFRLEPEKAKSRGYWLAWLISRGVNRISQKQDDPELVYEAHRELFEEVIMDINIRMLKANGVDDYAKYSKQINESSKCIRNAIKKYYSNLHSDFLYPAFKSPPTEKTKQAVLKYMKIHKVPVASSSKKMLVLTEEVFVRELQGLANEIPFLLAYSLTYNELGKDWYWTPEWGYMKSECETASQHEGKWPIDLRFYPNFEFTKAKKEDDERRKKGVLRKN
jgi:hypothetical protein